MVRAGHPTRARQSGQSRQVAGRFPSDDARETDDLRVTREARCPSFGVAFPYASFCTGFVSAPIFSISMVTLSPVRNQLGGFRAMPTPCGVPVVITVPGNNVVLPLRNSIKVGTSKIMSRVFDSCLTSPLTMVLIASVFGFGISSVVTRQGPSGQKVSKVLPRHHWLPPRLICQSRALTSLPQV